MTTTDILCLPGWKAGDTREADDCTIIEASITEVPSACPACGSVRLPYRFGYRPIQIAVWYAEQMLIVAPELLQVCQM